MKKLSVGWVGAGFVGQAAHLERFVDFPNAEVKALAEKRHNLRNKVATSYQIEGKFSDHKELLENTSTEAIVAVVNRRHTFQVAKDVLQSGKHLLTEKPMAQTRSSATQLADLSKEKGVIYSVGFMRRYDSGVLKAKDLIDKYRENGEIGNIISVRIFVEAGDDYCGIQQRIKTDEPRPPTEEKDIAPEWLNKELHKDYEKFVNICSHDVNLLRFLIPEEPVITAVDYRAEGYSYALMDFDNFPGILEWVYRPSDSDGWKEGMEINFEKGKISLNLPPAFLRNISSNITLSLDSSTNSREVSDLRIRGDYSWAFENSDRAFVDAVLSGKQTYHSGEDSVRDFDIIDQIWKKL